MVGDDQDQGAASERVREVRERGVGDHDDVGERQEARAKRPKKKKMHAEVAKKIDHASMGLGPARQWFVAL